MENVRIEVGSKLLWKSHSHMSHSLLDACIVTVTRIYKDCSFCVQDAKSKDKGRFKDSRSGWERSQGYEDNRPEVREWGNNGWGKTSGQVYPLSENVTDISLKTEIDSQKNRRRPKRKLRIRPYVMSVKLGLSRRRKDDCI